MSSFVISFGSKEMEPPGMVLKTVVICLFYLIIGFDKADDYSGVGVTPSKTAVKSEFFS